MQVAVRAAVGQLALGLGERDQRVVLAGEVAQPVVVLAAVGEQVDDFEPAVEVREVAVATGHPAHDHRGVGGELTEVELRAVLGVADHDQARGARGAQGPDQPDELGGQGVGLDVVADAHSFPQIRHRAGRGP